MAASSRLGGRRGQGLGAAAVLAALGVLWPAPSYAAPPASSSPTPSASPTSMPPAKVSLRLHTSRPHAFGATVTLIADLAPDAAFGDVTLYDGGTKLAAGNNYQVRWSYTTDLLTAGPHHFTVYFTPTAASGYAPAAASLDYVVKGAKASTSCPSAPGSASPVATTSAVASVSATASARPSHPTSPVPSSSVVPTSSVSTHPRHHPRRRTKGGVSARPTSTGSTSAGGAGHALPFTGLDAIGLVTAALLLILQGTALVTVARRRRRGPGGSHLA
jgi:hypothetical protein